MQALFPFLHIQLFPSRNEIGCVYLKPDLLPIPFYVVWILNNGFNVGWLFLWDRE